jgi:hypothetical protein
VTRPLLAEWPYLTELVYQSRLALAAADAMTTLADRMWPPEDHCLPPPESLEWFDHAQRFFCSAGIIAKILYAPDNANAKARDKARAARSRWLRDLLGLRADSPLADATVRNANEHIDERVDRWTARNPDAWRHAGHGISQTGQTPPEPPMRHYDSTADTLWIWDTDPVVVGPVVEATRDLQHRIRAYRGRLSGAAS